MAAVGVSNAQWNLGRVLGPVFAALAMSIGGVGAALWCNAVSFLSVVAAAAAVRMPPPSGERRPVLGALADGQLWRSRSGRSPSGGACRG
jgi:hypothetical protein